MFEAWEALAGGKTVRSLSLEAIPLLGTILEAFLRVQEFDQFERLLPLLHGSPLPVREQRELLASLYLRRGFLASAAEEWMAVCNERTNARAMVGLAQVAAAHGLPEDAATFASEALTLDPRNPVTPNCSLPLPPELAIDINSPQVSHLRARSLGLTGLRSYSAHAFQGGNAMNFNIGSVGSAGVTPVQGSGAARSAKASSAKSVDEAAVVVETFPSSPPEDVQAAMATASASYDKLQRSNQHISFRIDDRSGKLQIQVHDLNGNVLFDLPPDKALKAAEDGTVD